jgi:hypothetical protein
VLALTELDGDTDGLTDGLSLADGEIDGLGEGETLDDGLADGEPICATTISEHTFTPLVASLNSE